MEEWQKETGKGIRPLEQNAKKLFFFLASVPGHILAVGWQAVGTGGRTLGWLLFFQEMQDSDHGQGLSR